MEKKLHLIAGLPRSGSTLLASILNQNPKFHTTITDVLCLAVKDAMYSLTSQMYHSVITDDTRKSKVIKGMIDNFYYDVSKEVVFNVNRSWIHIFHMINNISPNTKLILCVRDICWILNSYEQFYQKHPFNLPAIYGTDIKQIFTVYGRSQKLFDANIKHVLEGMKEVHCGVAKKNVMFLEYNNLCKSPKESMKQVYNFLDEPYYDHDFNNVEANQEMMDKIINAPGFHSVRKSVYLEEKDPVIPPDIWRNMHGMEFWRK